MTEDEKKGFLIGVLEYAKFTHADLLKTLDVPSLVNLRFSVQKFADNKLKEIEKEETTND